MLHIYINKNKIGVNLLFAPHYRREEGASIKGGGEEQSCVAAAPFSKRIEENWLPKLVFIGSYISPDRCRPLTVTAVPPGRGWLLLACARSVTRKINLK